MQVFRDYLELTKAGICWFAVMCALAGYALSVELGQSVDITSVLVFGLGFYFVCAGGFALNQAQEVSRDALMERTRRRPIPAGRISLLQAVVLAALLIVSGLFLVALVSTLAAGLSALTLVLYNGMYTVWLKPRYAFAAVPGAIPGAMPVVIGYAGQSSNILSRECVYLFLVLFLWQMPHFWSLAIRFKEDYQRARFPVLPAVYGNSEALFQIGLYLTAYLGVVALAPLFINSYYIYLIFVMPLVFKLAWEFFRYLKRGEKGWLAFFLWVNASALVFILAPVADKWFYFYSLLV